MSVGNVTNTQSLAHMSATQKLKIVDMDARSDAGSEADEEEVKAEESLENEPEDVVMEEKSEQVCWTVSRKLTPGGAMGCCADRCGRARW